MMASPKPYIAELADRRAVCHLGWLGQSTAARQMPSVRRLTAILNEYMFQSLAMPRQIIEAWRLDHNGCRLHTSLDSLAPNSLQSGSNRPQNRLAVMQQPVQSALVCGTD